MKILNKIILPALMMALLFASCRKDDVDEITSAPPSYSVDTIGVNPMLNRLKSSSTDTIQISCVKIPLPVTFRQASGSSITVNNQQEFDAAQLNPDSLVDFIYPFNSIVNGSNFSITVIDDLALAVVTCSSRPTTCADLDAHVLLFYNALNLYSVNKYVYTINYPVTVIVDGVSIVLNNDDDYLSAIGGDPSRPKDAQLVYPITVNQFGRTITLNNDDDVCQFYFTLFEPCVNKPPHIQFFFNEGPGTPGNCTYFINYPLTVNMNGNPMNIVDRDAYLNLLNSSPNAYNGISLVYPVSAQRFNNNQNLVFISASDICQYLDTCQ